MDLNGFLSGINQILDGLGIGSDVGQFILDAIAWIVNGLTELFNGIGA